MIECFMSELIAGWFRTEEYLFIFICITSSHSTTWKLPVIVVDIFLRCCHQGMRKRVPRAPRVAVYSCSCSCVLYLRAFHKRRDAQVCMCIFLTWPHSCGADVRVFLPFVSSNFLPSCQGKCLQRHLPMLNAANVCCSEGSHMPSGEGLSVTS